MNAPASVMITGGRGFIGRRVTARLAAAGVRVTVFDDGSAGLSDPAGATTIQGDVRNRAAVEAAMAAALPEAVMHLAAIHHIPTCTAEPHRALDVNVLGTQVLLEAAAAHGVGLVVLASSGAVYDWREGALEEDMPVWARDIYAASKIANEHQLTIWADSAGRRGRIARMFNVIGPGDPNGHLVPDILGRLAAMPADAAEPGRLRLGDLDRRRDYIDVEDAADGLIALMNDPDGAPLATYNLCSGIETSVRDMAQMIADATGRRIVCESDPGLVRARDRVSQLGSPARANARLGWRPRRTLAETLKRVVESDGRFAG